jgi:hypothetical protein
LIKQPRVIEPLRWRHLRNHFRRRRCGILLIEPSLDLAGGALDIRRWQLCARRHRRGFSPAADGCGMYGLDLVAPSGVIDKRPGGGSEQPTE